MKALGQSSIASFIRVVIEATWWMVVVAMVLVAGMAVFSLTGGLDGKNLTVGLPVGLEVLDPVQGAGASLNAEGRIKKLRGTVRFPTRRSPFIFGSMLLIAVLSACFLWFLTQLRHIFRSLSRGEVFIVENARRLRWVGGMVIVSEMVRSAFVLYASYYASANFSASGLRFEVVAELDGTAILAGLAIIVIAEVFREGTRLQEDQSLTV